MSLKEKTKVAFRVTREIVAILFWLYLFLKIFVLDIDNVVLTRFAPDKSWLLNYRLIFVLPACALLWLVFRRDFFLFIGYIVLYPFRIFFWVIPKSFVRNWPLTIAFAAPIYEAIRTFRSTFISYSFAFLAACLILFSSDKIVLLLSMFFVLLIVPLHLFKAFGKAYRSGMFAGLSKTMKKFRNEIENGSAKETSLISISGIDKKIEVDTEKPDTEEAFRRQLLTILFYDFAFDFVRQKLEHIAASRKPDLYLFVS